MDWLNQFHFIRPWFLLAIPLTAAILWFRHQSRQQQGDLQDFCDPHLAAALMDTDGNQSDQQKHKLVNIAILALFIFTALGLAGPSWEKQAVPLLEPQNARVVVLGLAPSMSKTDIAPSRFERAKFKTMDLIRSSPALLQALVIYSGDAFVVSPLSDDHNTILNLLKAIELDTVPTAGNRADKGLELAAQLLDQPSLTYREIVLVTDTASPLTLSIAQQLSAQGVDISVLSVNLETAPSVDVLRAIAGTGNGAFNSLQAGDQDIEELNSKLQRSSLLNLSKRQQSQDQFGAEQDLDRGVWLLILALVMAPFFFRKGWLLCLAALPIGLMPPPAHALEWQDLWQRQDQQAALLYKQEKFDEAQLKRAKQWQGVSAYRNQDYEAALTFLGEVEEAESRYNAGNSHAQNGEFEEALAAYQQAIDLNASHADAKHNLEIINKIMEQQSQKQQSEQDSDQDQESQENEDQQESDSEQQSDSDSDSESESESSESKPSQTEEGQTEEEQTEQDQKQQQGEASEESEESGDQEQPEHMQAEELKSEDQQALEQWLRKLPDDPGALLKRKFKVQHQQRQQSTQ